MEALKCLFVACILVPSSATFHKFFSGQCPHVEPMPDFNVGQFLGQWFVIENYNDNIVSCLRENFTQLGEHSNDAKEMIDMARNEVEHEKDPEPTYQLERKYLSFGGRQMMQETGKIKFCSNTSQAEMEIGFPYTETGMLNLKHYQVLATDYDRYALVWRCQRTIFGHRRAAQIMSRKTTIEPKTLHELRAMLKQVEKDESIRLNEISQVNCEQPISPAISNWHSPEIPPIRVKPSKNRDPPSDLEILESNKPSDPSDKGKPKDKKKLISIDVGGFHLSISLPFFGH